MPGRIVAAVLLAACLAIAAGLAMPTVSRQASDLFWQRFWVTGSQVEQYDNLMTMSDSSDAVILGRIVDVSLGRVFGDREEALPYPDEALVRYATITVEVEELLRGELFINDAESIALEVMIGGGESDAVESNFPQEDAIFFLRNKGAEVRLLGFGEDRVAMESPYYRLVIASALLRIFDGRIAPAYATEEGFLLELDGTPLDEVLAQLRA